MHLKNFKKVLAAFGVLALLLSQNSASSVLAEEKGPAQVGEQLTGDEVDDGDEVKTGDEVDDGDEVNDGDEVKTGDEIQDGSGLTTGNETEEDEDNENGGIQLLSLGGEPLPVSSGTVQDPTDLTWTAAGAATFTNPNDFDVWCQVQLYKGETRVGAYSGWSRLGAHQTSSEWDLFPMVREPGNDYKFRVIITDQIGSNGQPLDRDRVASAYSGEKSFGMASDTLPTPTVTVTGDGKVHCEVPETYKDKLLHFGYVVREGVDGEIITNFGGEHFSGDTYQEDMDVLNTGGKYGPIETNPKYDYYVSVCAYALNPSTCNSSSYSGWVKILAATESSEETVSESSQSSGEPKSEPVVEEWKPSTPEETERYAAYGRETVACTAAAGSAYPVTVANAMQGSKCFDSFKAVLSDYTIGRTYNIMPSGKKVYHMDQKVKMTLTIPTALQGSGRIFKVICVTENGRPIVLNDLDSAEKTITFETDSFYAFALAYKDLK